MNIVGNKSSRINSLVLHRIVSHESNCFEDVSCDTLRCLLSMQNLRFLNLDAAMLDRGEDNIVCLTFDDGYSSDWDLVFPMLHEMGAKATFFVVTDWIGKPGFLSAKQIRKLHKSGMQIGSHSCSHPNLLELNHNLLEGELVNSRLILEDLLGEPITSFSLPFGIGGHATINAVLNCGYTHCCTSNHGVLRGYSNVIPRNSINKYTKITNLHSIVKAGIGQQYRWWAEDLSKSILKKYMASMYLRIRSVIVGV
jgi:hypothetical protein